MRFSGFGPTQKDPTMPRTTINYSLIENPLLRKAKAIEDIQTYMGMPAFNHFMSQARILHKTPPPLRSIAFPLAFLIGIEGYPVEAFYEYIFGCEAVDKDLSIKLVDSEGNEVASA